MHSTNIHPFSPRPFLISLAVIICLRSPPLFSTLRHLLPIIPIALLPPLSLPLHLPRWRPSVLATSLSSSPRRLSKILRLHRSRRDFASVERESLRSVYFSLVLPTRTFAPLFLSLSLIGFATLSFPPKCQLPPRRSPSTRVSRAPRSPLSQSLAQSGAAATRRYARQELVAGPGSPLIGVAELRWPRSFVSLVSVARISVIRFPPSEDCASAIP